MRAVLRFLADFVIGDDWRIAAGVTAVLAGAALLVARTGASDAAVAILAVVGFLTTAAISLRRP